MDLVRHLLLNIEEEMTEDHGFDWTEFGDEDYEPRVCYDLVLMHEAGLIHAAVQDMGSRGGLYASIAAPQRLTWDGHEYLDTIRDEAVWRKTKQAVQAAGGFSLKVLAGIATAAAIEAGKLKARELDLLPASP